jgi:hypothetical protein
MFPKSGAPMEADTHFRALLNISFWVPSKGAPPPGPLHGTPHRQMPCSYSPSSFIFHSPQHISPPPNSRFPLVIKGPLWRDSHIQRI